MLQRKIPAWPFVVTSFGLGAMALLPYFALWRPDRDLKLPPTEQELVRGSRGAAPMQRGTFGCLGTLKLPRDQV